MMRRTLLTFIAILICLMPFQTMADETAVAGYTDQADYVTPDLIRQVQEALNSAGYNCGTADGLAGEKTKSAIEQYKKDKQLSEVSEEITDELLLSLHVKMDERDEYLSNVAKSLDPGIILQTGEADLKMERVYDGDGTDHIEEFILAACRMLKAVAEDGRYSSMTATFKANNSFEVILFSNIEGNNEFTTAYYGPMSSDANVKLEFPDDYKKVFGAHDKTFRSENELKESGDELKNADKKLREDYRNGWYWALCYFDPEACTVSIGDDIELQIPANNTVEDGWNSCQQLTEAVDMFNYICNTDPLSMPYSKLSVNYIDQTDGTTSLYAFSTEESQDTGVAAESRTTDNAFAAGFAAFGKGMTLEEAKQAYLASIQKPAQNPSQDPAQNNVQNPSQDSTQNSAQNPSQDLTQNSAQNPPQNPAQNNVQKPPQDPAQNNVQNPPQDPATDKDNPGDNISENVILPEPIEPQLLTPVPLTSEADSQQPSPSQTLAQ